MVGGQGGWWNEWPLTRCFVNIGRGFLRVGLLVQIVDPHPTLINLHHTHIAIDVKA